MKLKLNSGRSIQYQLNPKRKGSESDSNEYIVFIGMVNNLVLDCGYYIIIFFSGERVWSVRLQIYYMLDNNFLEVNHRFGLSWREKNKLFS